MKILVIFFCLMSTKWSLGLNDRGSSERLNYIRRRIFPPNPFQRFNPDMTKFILLKNLIELDCLKGVYYQNRQNDRQSPKYRKLFPTSRFETMSAFRNPFIRSLIIRNGAEAKYFMNPKIIIVPSLAHAVGTTGNDFLTNRKKKRPANLFPASKNGKEKKIADTKKGESFRKKDSKGDFKAHLINAERTMTKNLVLKENQTVSVVDYKVPGIPLQSVKSSNVTYRETTPNSFGFLRPNLSQAYEVKEIIKDTKNKEKENLKKMRTGDKTYFDNEIKAISSEKQEQEVLDKSIFKILKEMMEPETSTQSTRNTVDEIPVVTRRKALLASTTASPIRISPPDGKKVMTKETIIPVKTTNGNEYPSRRNFQYSDWFPIKKLDNGQGALKPLKKIPVSFEVTPSNTTKNLTHGTSTSEKIIINKETTESPGLKPEAIPVSLTSFSLPFMPTVEFENSSRPNPPKENSPNYDGRPELMTKEHLSYTTQSISQTFTASVQVDNIMLFPFTHGQNTSSTLKSVNHMMAEVKSTTVTIPQGKFFTATHKSDLTTPNSKDFSDGPLSIDLLSTTVEPESKKEQESSGKNSRKMHFNQDTQKKATFDEAIESSDPQPRRSDILITDYLEDYNDNDNRIATINYLERIKPNDTILTDDFLTNLKIDSYIPLIPDILNDIRENQISRQDLSLLSDVFGKYWPKILALSNKTELDVLPLLTMKNEKDLITVLDSHFSNEVNSSTTVTGEAGSKEFPEPTYDYMDEYKDLYDYELGQELGEKRKLYRQKRDDELENQKLEANNEYFESLEEEERNERIEYTVEYTMYDDLLEAENPSELELIKPADMYLNVKNVTYWEEQN